MGKDILTIERPCILECVLGLDGDILCRDETAARRESQTVRVFGVENRIDGALFPCVYIDIALFEPDHIRGEGGDLFFGELDAGRDSSPLHTQYPHPSVP